MKGQKFESTEDGPTTEGKATGAVMPERPGQKETKEGKGEPSKAMEWCWESQWQEVLKMLPSPHSACRYPQLPESSPWDNTKAFLASFEQVAMACQWPREEWAARLLPALSGEAEQAFQSLEAGDQEDYGKVKAAILRGEALRREVQRQLFRQFCCQEVEDPRRLHRQLQELCRQWLKPERHSKEQILELLILEQFLASLPPDLQGWIRAGGPDSCSQAVALVEDFLMGQQEAETEKWQGLVSRREAGLGLKRFKGNPAPLDPQTVLQQVLQEEEGHVSSTGDKMGRKDQMDNSQCFRIEPTDTPRATRQIRHAHVTMASEMQEEGSESAEEQGRHLLEQENKCKNHQDDLTGAIGQPSMGQTRDHVPVFSKYGRQYHYRAELDMMPASEVYNDYPTSEKALQQNSCSGKYQKTIPRESKPEFSEHRKVGSFNQNQNNHTEETPHNSPEYGDSFSDAKSLKRNQGIQGEGKLYKCTYCDKCFSKSKHLLNHQQCECPESGEIFTFRQALVRNQETYCGVEPYVCSQCGKCFAQKGSLMCHLRIHTGEKPYKCSYCGKSFRQTGALLGHQRIHTGEKPYKCSQCGKSFSYKGNLICHQRIHTGVKPYKCSQCGKCFSQSGHLMSHLRIHNGEKPYRCPLCEKSFSQRGALVNHQKVHLAK